MFSFSFLRFKSRGISIPLFMVFIWVGAMPSYSQGDVGPQDLIFETVGGQDGSVIHNRLSSQGELSSNSGLIMEGEGFSDGGDLGPGRFQKNPIRFSFEILEGYNSNVNTSSTDPIGSAYTMIGAGVGYDFGNSRLTLVSELAASLAYYYSAQEWDNFFPTIEFNLAADYSATPRVDFFGTISMAYLTQPTYGVGGSAEGDQGPYFYLNPVVGAKVAIRPKISSETTYSLSNYTYTESYQQNTIGRVEQTLSQEFLYLWKPTTSLVVEYRLNPRLYVVAQDMDSLGQYFLLGFDHTLNPQSTVVFRAGAEQRWLNTDTVFPSGDSRTYFGPYGQLALNYVRKRTAFNISAQYGTQASGYASYDQSQSFQISSSVSRDLTSRLKGTVYFNYQNNVYDPLASSNLAGFTSNVYDTGINLSYKLTRRFSLLAGYEYSATFSQNKSVEYNRNVVYLGGRMDF